MKQLTVLLLLVLTTSVVFAQNKDINTARTQLNNYRNYDKESGKTNSLVKAKDAIEKALSTIATKQEANDSKLKDKTVAKAWFYKMEVYSELATLEEPKLAENIDETIIDAAKNILKYDKSKTYRNQAVGALDGVRIAAYNEGVKLYREKDFTGAFETFQQSLSLNKAVNEGTGKDIIDTSAIAMSAYAAQNGEMVDKAIPLYEKLVELNFDDAQIYNALSGLYLANADTTKAGEIITKGKEKFPTDANLLIADVNFALKTGSSKEVAIEKMAAAIDAEPENESLHFALGTTYFEMGDKENAMKYYQSALDLKEDYFDALYNLGLVYYQDGAKKIEEANEVDINDQETYDKLMKESTDLFTKALPFFVKAHEAKPKDYETLVALKEISAKTGDIAKAKEYKEKIEALN